MPTTARATQMITPAETAAVPKALPAVAEAAKALPQAEVKLPTQAAVAVRLPMPVAAEAAVKLPEAAKLPAATAHSHSRAKLFPLETAKSFRIAQ